MHALKHTRTLMLTIFSPGFLSASVGRVGMVTVVLSVVKTERLLGLWKGMSAVSAPNLDLHLHFANSVLALCLYVATSYWWF